MCLSPIISALSSACYEMLLASLFHHRLFLSLLMLNQIPVRIYILPSSLTLCFPYASQFLLISVLLICWQHQTFFTLYLQLLPVCQLHYVPGPGIFRKMKGPSWSKALRAEWHFTHMIPPAPQVSRFTQFWTKSPSSFFSQKSDAPLSTHHPQKLTLFLPAEGVLTFKCPFLYQAGQQQGLPGDDQTAAHRQGRTGLPAISPFSGHFELRAAAAFARLPGSYWSVAPSQFKVSGDKNVVVFDR